MENENENENIIEYINDIVNERNNKDVRRKIWT